MSERQLPRLDRERVRRVSASFAVAFLAASSLTGQPVAASQDQGGAIVPELRFWVGDVPSSFGVRNGVSSNGVDEGRWAIERVGSMPNGEVYFEVEVVPPPVASTVDPGPALLYVALMLHGSPGADVGWERSISLQAFDAGACTGDPCAFRTDIAVDLRPIAGAIRRNPRIGVTGAGVTLQLVRSFGQGRWLQVLDLLPSEGASRFAKPGTTRRLPTGAFGRIPSSSVFRSSETHAQRWDREHSSFDLATVMDASRLRQGDESVQETSVVVDLRADVASCGASLPLRVHTAEGLVAYERLAGEIEPAGEAILVPDRTEWLVTLGDPLPGRYDLSARAGSFKTAGADVQLTVVFDCSDPERLEATGFESATASAPAQLRIGNPWSQVWSSSDFAPPAHYGVVPHRSGFLAVQTDGGRWVARTSGDGWRWRQVSMGVRGRPLPPPADVVATELVRIGDAVALVLIWRGTGGGHRLRSWVSRDGSTWVSPPRGGALRLSATPLDLQAIDGPAGLLARIRTDDGTRLAGSSDGRSWRRLRGPDVPLRAIGPGVGRAVAVRTDDHGSIVVDSGDGRVWRPLFPVPDGARAPFGVLETTDGVVITGATADPSQGATAWLWAPLASQWRRLLTTRPAVRISAVRALGDVVVLAGDASTKGSRHAGPTWLATSVDGGSTWYRDLPQDPASGRCRLVPAISLSAIVVGTDGCFGAPTVWRTSIPDPASSARD